MGAIGIKNLSEKELEVTKAICKGGTNKEIAVILDISVNTLKTHLQHIYKKLEIHSKTDLIVKYFNQISPELSNSQSIRE